MMKQAFSAACALSTLFAAGALALSACGSDSKSPAKGGSGGAATEADAGSGGQATGSGGSVGAGGNVADASPGAGGSAGSGSGGAADGAAPPDAAGEAGPAPVSHAVTKGVAVRLPLEGGGSLILGPSTLAADVTITVSVQAPSTGLPDASTIVGSLYDLGPSGTTFTPAAGFNPPYPAYLALPVPTLASGTTAVISTKERADAAWTDLPTIVSGGMAYAAVTHFSDFVTRTVPDTSSLCTAFDTACQSGSIVGTWKVAAFCNGEINTYQAPSQLLSACPGVAPVSPMQSAGTITINADLTTASTVAVPYRSTSTAALPSTCLAAYTACDEVAAAILAEGYFIGATCTGTVATACDCTAVNPPSVAPTVTAGTAVLSAGKLSVNGLPARDYCVTGSNLSYSYGSQNSVQFGFLLTP